MKTILAVATITLAIAGVAKADNCKLTEQEIRQVWVAARGKTEAERLRRTEEVVKGSEDFCRKQKNLKPTPLPPGLNAR